MNSGLLPWEIKIVANNQQEVGSHENVTPSDNHEQHLARH